jgi:DNA-nicking Smr family endonuclease
MKSRRSAVSPEDQALFLAAVDGATPLSGRDRVRVPAAPPSPVRVAELPPEIKLAVEGDGRRYTARAPGVSRSQVADLRAGKIRVDETLDLHGETVDTGVQMLRELFVRVHRSGRRCILIVHGKGLHSEAGAPLREAVVAELLGPLSGLVYAMATAASADGGEGATYVIIRGPR